ncbi:hypothetical protein QWJ34_11015 [Saccharibacillus sp. CPCC 101409]|uniref:hypothetical protein n=1 Tax=Saccharibacillus sp. CPCC 101409 TaxID=3058041 RepID=UPI0026731D3F|nr:hypothetical protein [Saccharibacillus sp. CPCC 101409]MDO3410292.1 hypothetical protein [Saccharibacillus sp. CPCC 101409]
MKNNRKRLHGTPASLAAALIVFGALTAGCGANRDSEAADKQAAPAAAQTRPTSAAAVNKQPSNPEQEQPAEKEFLNKKYYSGTSVRPEQIDLLNESFRAQNAGDEQAYSALFAADAPDGGKQIAFTVDKIELNPSGDIRETNTFVGSYRETADGEYHPVAYTLSEANGQWRIADILRADGPYADESGYDGEELDMLKLINASIERRNAGDAEGYAQKFTPNAQMGVLQDHPGKVAETLIADIRYLQDSPTTIVNVLQRYEEEKDTRGSAYALQKQNGNWIIVDID